jgi:hypothetical protein
VAREHDHAPRLVRAGSSAYRGVLHLFPHGFRSRYASELEDDFLALSCDAWQAGGAGALVRWWVTTAVDTIFSFVREWRRTAWLPALAIAASVACAVFWAAMGRAQRPLHDFRHLVAPGSAPVDSPALLVLMALMVVIPAAALVVFSIVARLLHHDARAPRARGRA